MRSDSATTLAARALKWVYTSNIDKITVMESDEASDSGFANYNGVVNITTSYRESLLFIINGLPYRSKNKVSAGEVLGGEDYIVRILKQELADIDEYGVNDVQIIEDIVIGCRPQRSPFIVVTTEIPYYSIDNLVGDFTAKSRRQSYTLKLNADSTYVFSKNYTRKKSIVPKISSYGKWRIYKSKLILTSSQAPAVLQGCTISSDTISLKINSIMSLTLPKGVWCNTKQITLKRERHETD